MIVIITLDQTGIVYGPQEKMKSGTAIMYVLTWLGPNGGRGGIAILGVANGGNSGADGLPGQTGKDVCEWK